MKIMAFVNCEKCALVGQCQENCEVTCQECDQVSVILIEPEANRTEMLTDDLYVVGTYSMPVSFT